MSEIVFILGAGASKEAGAPVMADFLDKALELFKLDKTDEFAMDFDRVFKARSKLQIIHSKSDFDISNIESVFTAFEMGRLIHKLPQLEGEDIEKLISSIRKLIQVTLEKTINFPIRNKTIVAPDAYHSFADLLYNLLNKGHDCSIITFNYDYALDFALNEAGIPADYCLPDQESGERREIPLLKLHGSLNWIRCDKCGHINAISIGKLKSHSNIDMQAAILTESIYPNFSTQIYKLKLNHCDINMNPDPVIVPPSWNKSDYQQSISAVWSKAAQELSNAENIIVSGYALNESDLFFRYLFALGAVGEKLIQRFWVFDTEVEEGIVNKRFQQMIGAAIKSRYHYFQQPFSQMSSILRKQLIK